MAGPRTASASRLFLVLAAGACCVLLSACLGDPPPDPATAPLEVVLDGCVLNRDAVGPGRHELSLIGSGSLVVSDESGAEMLSAEGAGGRVAASTSLTTSEQTYTFACTVDSVVTEARLDSAP